MGVGEGVTFPAWHSLYARWVPFEERARAIAFTNSGIAIGTIIGYIGTQMIIVYKGWELAFYIFGILGLLWFIFWYRLVSSFPTEHSSISPAELRFITENAPSSTSAKKIPLSKLFLNKPFLAIVSATFANNWSLFIFLSFLPKFINNELGSDVSFIVEGKKIYAHNQTLSQCTSWLTKNYHNVERIATDSNAKAALSPKKYKNSACIANEICSKLYKLKIISRNIHDVHNNTTRFLIIGNTDVSKSNNDKTTFIMSLENKSGSLAKILQVLSANKISMTKIESIPTKENNWEYLFLIDLSGHICERKVTNALDKIESSSKFFQLLGSYPKSID